MSNDRRKPKNKAPAPLQMTAEQLLREANDMRETIAAAPAQRIHDMEELSEYKLRKRKEFEDHLRKNRAVMKNYLRYATWEAAQKEFRRARSIYERALDVNSRDPTIWTRYAEMEMTEGHINSARNIWDRAVTILPRIDHLWFKFSFMEETVGNIPGARQVFERWMEWQPDEAAWLRYIKFEERYKEYDLARRVLEAFIVVHPSVEAYIRYAKFEEGVGQVARARAVYERLFEALADKIDENAFVSFAKFETRNKEIERARAIYRHALDNLPKSRAAELYKEYTLFEKRFGDRAGIDDVIVSKRRFQYEEALKSAPDDYDTWFEFLRLEEENGEADRVRDVYERAISRVPPIAEKRYWERYIFLWIKYAMWEELVAKDCERARAVYAAVRTVIPHKAFSFSKIWILSAQLELRMKDLAAARKILGTAIGMAPSVKIFDTYISLEFDLLEFDRCRTLYGKYLEFSPESCAAWIKYAKFEVGLGETDRARAIYDVAVEQPLLDMPEVLWKSYIDFEIENEEHDKTYALFERLLERTQHVKVWISLAEFAASLGDTQRARQVYGDADRALRSSQLKEERVLLLESWKDFEKGLGQEGDVKTVTEKMPRKVKARRMVKDDDGTALGWEEYFDYIFPDEKKGNVNLALLEKARAWKAAAAAAQAAKEARGGSGDERDDEEEVFDEDAMFDGEHSGGGDGVEKGDTEREDGSGSTLTKAASVTGNDAPLPRPDWGSESESD